MADPLTFLRDDGETIAYNRLAGQAPGILWLGGFHSDMTGTKAQALSAWAERQNRAFVRFDYLGHGQSSGDFARGTISRWRDDALAVLDNLTEGPQILVGSSMGGWIATLLARLRPQRVAGLLLIAPAPDFTEDLVWAMMPLEVRAAVMETGQWLHQCPPDEAVPITKVLIEDGRNNLVLHSKIAVNGPVRILHGSADVDVPWRQGVRLVESLEGDIQFTLVKGSDHRMSSPADLERIETTLEMMLEV